MGTNAIRPAGPDCGNSRSRRHDLGSTLAPLWPRTASRGASCGVTIPCALVPLIPNELVPDARGVDVPWAGGRTGPLARRGARAPSTRYGFVSRNVWIP